nr:putative baseplate assembly protein [Kineosporia babensis]
MPRFLGRRTIAECDAYWIQAVGAGAGKVTVAVIGGTTPAEHSELVSAEVLGHSNGQPGQTFTTSQSPVAPRQHGEQVAVTGPDGEDLWTEVADFSRSGPTDRHFVWDAAIQFGPAVRQPDGWVKQQGAVPPADALIWVTKYRVGGGVAGNVAAHTLTTPLTALPRIAGVTNRKAATGGSDAETLEQFRIRGPLTLRTGQRAVTAADYEQVALATSPRVARARCLPASQPDQPAQLMIVPHRPPAGTFRSIDDFALEEGLLTQLTDAVEAQRVIGTSIELTTPYYIGVALECTIQVHTDQAVRDVHTRLRTWLDPIDGSWPFDQPLTTRAVADRIRATGGVTSIEDVRLYAYDCRLQTRVGPARETLELDADSLFLLAEMIVVTL